MSAAVHNFEYFCMCGGPEMVASVESVLKSILVQSWGSFEVMAGDLWEWVLNEHPQYLAGLNGKSSKRGPSITDDTESKDQKGQDRRTLELSYLDRHNFNLSGVMGTVLRESVAFTKLDSIRKAYRRAFGKDYDKLDFYLNNESLDALSAVRNVLVHKAGNADAEFKEKVDSLKSLEGFRLCVPGSKLPLLTGITVRDLVSPMVSAAIGLIESVDEWLTLHPQTT